LEACATYSEVRYCLTTEEGLVGPLVAQLKRMLERSGLRDSSGAFRVATAIDEALQNAIVHGNLEVSSKLREGEDGTAYHVLVSQRRQLAPFKDRRTHVRACVTPESAEFVIRDEGPGFDPKTIPNPTDPKYLDRPCGRGLWLIHAFTDEVRHNETGNEITIFVHKKSQKNQ
jgi:anti-sigma regulatory factor (Ser/Thr protein kinase)